MTEDFKSKWSQIVKYSTIFNATALTLSLTTVTKSANIHLDMTIGKFPIWCFFIGLVFGSLQLLFSFYYLLSREIETSKLEIAKMETKLAEIQSEALSTGSLNFEIEDLRNKIGHMRKQISDPDFNMPDGAVDALRFMQESLLWASYAAFFTGLFVVVVSI
jgi:hypothetical protein